MVIIEVRAIFCYAIPVSCLLKLGDRPFTQRTVDSGRIFPVGGPLNRSANEWRVGKTKEEVRMKT